MATIHRIYKNLSALSRVIIRPQTFLLGVLAIAFIQRSGHPTISSAPSPLVIGVASWRHVDGPFINVQENTFQHLKYEIERLGLDDVRIVHIPESLRNALDVDAIGSKYSVDVVVWGWYDKIAVRSYVDLVNSTRTDGMTNDLSTFLEKGGNPEVIRVLKVLSEFDYDQDGVSFCVPRWTP
jgi:hypothetical protein